MAETTRNTTASPLVFFDLETSSLDPYCEILQIAAVAGEHEFNTFIMPKNQLCSESSKINGFTVVGDVLMLNGEALQAKSAAEALSEFIEWLKMFDKPLLAAHWCRWFDADRLVRQLRVHEKLDDFRTVAGRFADTHPLFKAIFAEEVLNFKLQTLVRQFVDPTYTQTHTALDDSKRLREVYEYSQRHKNIRSIEDDEFTFPVAS